MPIPTGHQALWGRERADSSRWHSLGAPSAKPQLVTHIDSCVLLSHSTCGLEFPNGFLLYPTRVARSPTPPSTLPSSGPPEAMGRFYQGAMSLQDKMQSPLCVTQGYLREHSGRGPTFIALLPLGPLALAALELGPGFPEAFGQPGAPARPQPA